MNSTAVVVPSWNSRDRIEDCIESLLRQEEPVDVVVVDNGSADGSAAIVRSRFPQVVVLPQPVNLGFAGGVNVGIRYALALGYDHVGLFNDDAVADPAWSRSLVEVLGARPEVGIVTGLLLDGSGDGIDSTGDWYSVWGLPFPRDRGAAAADAPPAGPVFGASGGASIYRASMLERIGLFDETFFAYYEDVDISFRAQLAGWRVWYQPAARALHSRGASSATMTLGTGLEAPRADKISAFTIHQTFKNLPLLFVKDVPRGLLAPVGARFGAAYGLMLGKAVVAGNGRPALSGLARSAALAPHAFRERRRIQGGATVDVRHVSDLLWADLPPDQTGLRRLRERVVRAAGAMRARTRVPTRSAARSSA